MGSFWLLQLALKCIALLSWPLLALVYPLCASIQAIESDSHSDTRNLICYWTLLSLIYLFEYAFLRLLQWLPYWPYMKLIIIAWLVIPDFDRASHVYNNLVRSGIFMNPQAVISRFRNRKMLFVEKENFLMQAEKYIKENGTDALENLIASKNTEQNLDTEAIKAVPATENTEATKALPATENTEATKALPAIEKNDTQHTNKLRLHVEQKDIKVLEMIETEEVISEGKQGDTASCSLKLKENTPSAVVETEGTAGKDTAGGDSPLISAPKKVQKEWTCAICQVTTTCEKNLNSHLQGSKHKANCEALKPKNQFSPGKKNNKSNEEQKKTMDIASSLKQKIKADQQAKVGPKNVEIINVKEYVKLTTNKDQQNKSKGVHANTKVQGLQNSIGMNKSRLRCEICNVNCTSEGDMASHLNGRRHLAQIDISRSTSKVVL